MKQVQNAKRKSAALAAALALSLCLSACSAPAESAATPTQSAAAETESAAPESAAATAPASQTETAPAAQTETAPAAQAETAPAAQTEAAPAEETPAPKQVDIDLTPSQGLEFESNGDGTCSIVGIGTCTDTDLVIPLQSPAGDTVTLIEQYAFMSLEDVNSVTLCNYTYEVEPQAFVYAEITALSIMGGAPKIGDSAFGSCEDLETITFSDCDLQIGKYAFLSAGKDAAVSFVNCTGSLDKQSFEYGDFASLEITGSTLEIDDGAFASCEDLTSIRFADSTITAGDYAFMSCGKKATAEMQNCTLELEDQAFEYSSLATLSISGESLVAGKNAFASCEHLTAVTIDCQTVEMDTYAFGGCDDLESVTICDNGRSDNQIELGDHAFAYSEKLQSVTIGSGNISIDDYPFSSCADNLTITIAGTPYTEKMTEDGVEVAA